MNGSKHRTYLTLSLFCVTFAGATSVGKSHFVLRLVQHRDVCFSSTFDRIIYACPENARGERREYIEKLQDSFPDLEVVHGFPSHLEDIHIFPENAEMQTHSLLILDDLIRTLEKSETYQELIERQSHHQLITVVVTTQNLFSSGSKESAGLRKNYSDFVIFSERGSEHTLRYLGSKYYPSEPKLLCEAMESLRNVVMPAERSKYLVLEFNPASNLPTRMMARF